MKLSLLSVLALSASVVVLSSCSTSTEPASSNIWKSSDVGTIYVFNLVSQSASDFDSTVSFNTSSQSLVVTATGQHVGDKTNVSRLSGPTGGTLALAYEPNGDFSLGDSTTTSWEWTTYPAGSHTTIADPVVDSVDDYGFYHYRAATRKYVGQESLTLAGHAYTAAKVVEEIAYRDSSSSGVTVRSGTTTIWWIPELKMFGRYDSEDSSRANYSGDVSWSNDKTSAVLVMYGQKSQQKSDGKIN